MTALEVKPTTQNLAANPSPRSQTAQLARLERSRKVRANVLLVLVTMIWGSTFLIARQHPAGYGCGRTAYIQRIQQGVKVNLHTSSRCFVVRANEKA